MLEADKQPSIQWLRPGAASKPLRGSFFAAPVTDRNGEVVGLVAADTCVPGAWAPHLPDSSCWQQLLASCTSLVPWLDVHAFTAWADE